MSGRTTKIPLVYLRDLRADARFDRDVAFLLAEVEAAKPEPWQDSRLLPARMGGLIRQLVTHVLQPRPRVAR